MCVRARVCVHECEAFSLSAVFLVVYVFPKEVLWLKLNLHFQFPEPLKVFTEESHKVQSVAVWYESPAC